MALMVGHDRTMSGQVSLAFSPGGTPKFQFPPVCVGDTKHQEWRDWSAMDEEKPVVRMGAEARRLSIEITYVVDGDWSIKTILTQIRMMKANMYGTDQATIRFVTVKFYDISEAGGTYRIGDISVAYEGPLIHDGTGSSHMIHKVKLDLAFYSQIGGKNAVSSPLVERALPQWY